MRPWVNDYVYAILRHPRKSRSWRARFWGDDLLGTHDPFRESLTLFGMRIALICTTRPRAQFNMPLHALETRNPCLATAEFIRLRPLRSRARS